MGLGAGAVLLLTDLDCSAFADGYCQDFGLGFIDSLAFEGGFDFCDWPVCVFAGQLVELSLNLAVDLALKLWVHLESYCVPYFYRHVSSECDTDRRGVSVLWERRERLSGLL